MPPDLVFPFDEAQRARSAALALSARLRRVREVHEDGWDRVRARRFEGSSARRLEQQVADRMAELVALADALRRQADQILDEIEAAQRAVRIREQAQRDWRRAHDAWASWRPPAPAAPAGAGGRARGALPPPTARTYPPGAHGGFA
ncbi:MAG: hypothetical protein ACLGIR_00370 [Actinomycetes bacterium]